MRTEKISRYILGRLLALLALTALSVAGAPPSKTLDMYFIDVEGGQSTLIVTPSRQSLLIDTGFPGDGTFTSKPGDPNKSRDASRIAATMRAAGVTRIDYLLITHFHADHDGGVPELAQLFPIGTFIDHDSLQQPGQAPGTLEGFDAYKAVRDKSPHVNAKVGYRIPLTGLEAVIVSAARTTLPKALSGAGQRNPACSSPELPAQDPDENPRSTGLRLQFGKFRFIDLGDLTGPPLFALFCPNDLLGPADVYVLPHHGGVDAAHPATFGAISARVVIMNNGATKGGHPSVFSALHAAGIDAWQVDRSISEGAVNFPDDRIANLDDKTSFWIQVSAKSDGSFVVTNGRTNATKAYGPR